MECKSINLLKKEGSIVYKDSPCFLLSGILEGFISDRGNDSRYSAEVALARRLVVFLYSDNLTYYEA